MPRRWSAPAPGWSRNQGTCRAGRPSAAPRRSPVGARTWPSRIRMQGTWLRHGCAPPGGSDGVGPKRC
eukprot:2515374-Heterocapsa_arctica.AAC.1